MEAHYFSEIYFKEKKFKQPLPNFDPMHSSAKNPKLVPKQPEVPEVQTDGTPDEGATDGPGCETSRSANNDDVDQNEGVEKVKDEQHDEATTTTATSNDNS